SRLGLADDAHATLEGYCLVIRAVLHADRVTARGCVDRVLYFVECADELRAVEELNVLTKVQGCTVERKDLDVREGVRAFVKRAFVGSGCRDLVKRCDGSIRDGRRDGIIRERVLVRSNIRPAKPIQVIVAAAAPQEIVAAGAGNGLRNGAFR